MRECRLDWSGSGKRLLVGSCERVNEASGSIKWGEFLDWLNNYCVLDKDFAARFQWPATKTCAWNSSFPPCKCWEIISVFGPNAISFYELHTQNHSSIHRHVRHVIYAVHSSTVTPSRCGLEKSEYCKWGQNKQKKTYLNGRQRQTNIHQQSIADRTATAKGTAGNNRILREIGAQHNEGPIYLFMIYLY